MKEDIRDIILQTLRWKLLVSKFNLSKCSPGNSITKNVEIDLYIEEIARLEKALNSIIAKYGDYREEHD